MLPLSEPMMPRTPALYRATGAAERLRKPGRRDQRLAHAHSEKMLTASPEGDAEEPRSRRARGGEIGAATSAFFKETTAWRHASHRHLRSSATGYRAAGSAYVSIVDYRCRGIGTPSLS